MRRSAAHLAALKDGREVEYGFLGVQPANLPAEEVLAGLRGVRVERVVPGSPAARCGLKTNDIVTAVGDARIDDADSLVLEVGRLPVEATARLSVLRDGRPLVDRGDVEQVPDAGEEVVTNRPPAWRGLRRRLRLRGGRVGAGGPLQPGRRRRRGGGRRSRGGLVGGAGGVAAGDADRPRRRRARADAEGVPCGRGRQVRGGRASPPFGRRGSRAAGGAVGRGRFTA